MHRGFRRRHKVGKLARAVFAVFEKFFRRGNLTLVRGNLFAHQFPFAVFPLVSHRKFHAAVVQLRQFQIGFGGLFAVVLVALVQKLRLRVQRNDFIGIPRHAFAEFVLLAFRAVVFINVCIHFVVLQRFRILAVFSRRVRLFGKRSQSTFGFFDALHINKQIVFGRIDFPFDFFLARFVHHQSRGFFENQPPVLRFRVHDLLNFTLPDNGVALFAETYAVEEPHDVFQTGSLPVDEITAVAVSVQTARHRHFGYVKVEYFICIVEHKRYFAA